MRSQIRRLHFQGFAPTEIAAKLKGYNLPGPRPTSKSWGKPKVFKKLSPSLVISELRTSGLVPHEEKNPRFQFPEIRYCQDCGRSLKDEEVDVCDLCELQEFDIPDYPSYCEKQQLHRNVDADLRSLERQWMAIGDPEDYNKYAVAYNRAHPSDITWICQAGNFLNLNTAMVLPPRRSGFHDVPWDLFAYSQHSSLIVVNYTPLRYENEPGGKTKLGIFWGSQFSYGTAGSINIVRSAMPGNRLLGQAEILRYYPANPAGLAAAKAMFGKKTSVPLFIFR
jgi:hypothetical protein